MNFDRLRHFVCIAELGSFSKAEAAMNISQPSLSRQMRLLEEDVNAKLFTRTGRGVRLTLTGQQLLPHARAILESVSRARSALGNQEHLSGRIVVGLPPRVARVLTPPLVEAFRFRLPSASISIVEGMTPTLTEGLLLGRVEVAALFNPAADPQILSQPICRERFVLVGRRTGIGRLPKTVRFQDLARFPLILPPLPNSIRVLLESERQRVGINFNVVVEVDTMQAIFDLMRLGVGMSIMPSGEVTGPKRAADLVVAEIGPRRLDNYVCLARAGRIPATRLGDMVLELIRGLNLPRLMGGERV